MTHALIAGGGIAGTVSAMAMQRLGITSMVFESHPPSNAGVGSYFTLTANGLEGLNSIGALELATTEGFPTRRNVLWNQSGKRLATLSLDSRVPGSPSAQTLKRSALARALQDEATRRGIRIEYGRRIADATTTPDGRVLATFDDGGTASGDLLVGADGVHSVVRGIVEPSAPAARYVGLTNFGGVTHGAAGRIEPETWHLTFGLRAFFGYQATPSGDVVWFANVPRPLISPEERASTSDLAWQDQLGALFAGDAGPAVDLIQGGKLELAADNTHDLGHVPAWHRGPIVIIGDAAHAPAPTSGQGASMAIEDGIVLARTLRRAPSIASAFDAYEQERRERVERIVAWGARGSSNKTPGRLGGIARDLMMQVLFRYVVTDTSLGWMYDYRADPDDAGRAVAA